MTAFREQQQIVTMKHRLSFRWILTAVLIAGATLAPAQGQEATPANGNLQARVAAAMTTVSPAVAEVVRMYEQGIAASIFTIPIEWSATPACPRRFSIFLLNF